MRLFKWSFAGGGPRIVFFGPSLHLSTKQRRKKRSQSCPPPPSDKTFWIRAWWRLLVIKTSRTVLAYKSGFCICFCLHEPIDDVLVIFFVLKLEVYVCLVKSLLLLSFYLSKQLKESSRTQILGVKPVLLCNNSAVVGIRKCVLQRHFDVNYYWI